MDRETARQEIRKRFSCKDYLTKSQGRLYCCPLCGSGTGPNKTGAVKYYEDSNRWKCHKCGASGDVIDLYMKKNGIAGFAEALSLMAQEAGIEIETYSPANDQRRSRPERPTTNGSGQDHRDTQPEREPQQEATEGDAEPAFNFPQYYKECRERITDPAAAAYLNGRGISIETAREYWIGFDPEADPAQSGHPCPRIIIPTNSGYYVGRSIDPKTPEPFRKMNCKGGKAGIFNMHVLYAHGVQEVFVTEGAFDALSILEAGAPAIALNSTANAGALIKDLEAARTEATLILALDNDDAGEKATETLREGLQRLNIPFITADICGECKDPNEALTKDRAAFIKAIDRTLQQLAPRPDNTRSYIETLMQGDMERFRTGIKTGFANLDDQTGGLYSGLYVLAAIPSLGKTSLALQIADQLAQSGQDVLFFSLEQSKLELVSKSIARRTAQQDMRNAVSSLQIRKGSKGPQITAALQAYTEAIADRLSIIEGNFACDTSFIGDYARRYIQRTGTRPVVFVDYLQILQPAEEAKKQTTRETIDAAVIDLKRLSREQDLTVFVISSVNRTNYLAPFDFESLKETGGIEYSADVVFGLQLRCITENPAFEKETGIKAKRDAIRAAKAETPRKIELLCLKNRYGISSFSCYFDYFPAADLFLPADEAAKDNPFTGWENAKRI